MRAPDRPPPRVTVVVPCYNEAGRIADLLQALHGQEFPLERLDVIIADGGSTDGTLVEIADFASEHPDLNLRVIENRKQIIPAALNQAIQNSTGDIIVRLDAHSAPSQSYILRCLEVLESRKAANVGGLWEIRPGDKSWIARAIAAAASHPLGAGDARYRISGPAGPVDTVPFGAFRREWLDRVGTFNEDLQTNEDYEYNARIRAAGGIVWFDPDIRSTYIARRSLGELARQYWRYGYWKLKMLRKFPQSLRWRQALPPVFVLTSIGLAAASTVLSAARWLLAVQLGVYLAVSLIAGVLQSLRHWDLSLVFGFPLAIWTMHYAWGAGFLWSALDSIVGGRQGANQPQ
jgi:succinoglycan biosynthesis protein ExoA